MTELYNLSASEAAAQIRDGQISPVDLVQALLDRIERFDPQVRAWETLDAEGALAAARECERQRGDAAAKPLFGVPFGAKDIFYTKGLRTTAGFEPFDQVRPDYDATSVARLKEAGAILLGKAVTTQFANLDPSKTRNPWNPERTPAGSSAGSGAAVAARMVPVALGTQTAGSVQRPGAYNGCLGFKPTYGRVSRYGVVPLSWSLDHVGFLVRTVADVALVLRSCAGHDPNDPGSARVPVPDYVAELKRESRPPRLGLVRDLIDRAEPEVREHVQGVAQRLTSAGAEIREVRYPGGMDLILEVHRVISDVEASAVHLSLWRRHPNDYAPKFRAKVEIGHLLPGAAYVHAQRLRRQLRAGMDELLGSVDCLLAPTASNVAPTPETTGDPSFQTPNSLFGIPALALPSGLTDGRGAAPARLPFSIQLIARPFDEPTLLRAAQWCEQVLGPVPAPF